MAELTLKQEREKIVEKRKQEFHYYVAEFGYEIAKEIILDSTILIEVRNYVLNFETNEGLDISSEMFRSRM